MYEAMAIIFILGYSAIALEHPLKLDKVVSALFTGGVCWVLLALTDDFTDTSSLHHVENALMHHLGEISGILFFLLGAMTIVELVDAHNGFSIITDRISTTKKSVLLISLSVVTFFMSAVLDNLTTSIVMATLLRKLIKDKKDLWLFAGMVVIAANAGGAWSPIGDVTTIMLWIGGQITAQNIVLKLFVPSLVCMMVPLGIMAYQMKGKLESITAKNSVDNEIVIQNWESKLILFIGVGALLFVPVFKSITHLPPFLGILLGLSILWGTTEILHRNKAIHTRNSLSIGKVLERVDTSSILFFLGILLAVASLQTAGHLNQLAIFLEQNVSNIWLINTLIGFLSSIVDNVPLVAAAMGMYELNTYGQDHIFWELLAYCAGTGGSCLIIGSAAGVAIMGILKIDFIWFMKKISLLAISGYLAGIIAFWLLNLLIQ